MKNQKFIHHEPFSRQHHFVYFLHYYLDNLDSDDHTYGVML